MAESRRVQLTTLSCAVGSFSSDTPDSVRHGSPAALQHNGSGSVRPPVTETVRLVFTLFEPGKRSFPEFNYSDLIENKLKQAEGDVPVNQLEVEEKREHDEAAAIARKLEEKYGGKHKKKDRIQDLVDIGYGYDEDSFIDNSEAYDEFVPSSLTTKFGGFYVNSGMLHFRQASDTDTDDFSTEEGVYEPAKKRKLDEEQNKPKKRCKALEEMKSNKNLSTLSKVGVNDLKIKRKKKTVKTLSVTSMLKKFQREKAKERESLEKSNRMSAITDANTTSLFPADAAGGGCSSLTDPLLSLIGSTNDHTLIQAASTVDFDIDLDSLLEASEESLLPKSLPQTTAEIQPPKAKSDVQIRSSHAECPFQSEDKSQLLTAKANLLQMPHSEQLQLQAEPSPVVPSQSTLPEGLPLVLEESIRNLITAAKTSEGESKLKFFSPDINSILLNIELQCQEQSSQLRSKVYKHLSSFMPCSKDTLLKRVKKLLITHEGEPPCAEDQLQKLKEAIEKSMPEQMACFQESCHAYDQSKASKETEEENMEEKSGRKSIPKKSFKWNQEIRDCLGFLLREKIEKCQKEGKEGQELEEYLKTVLDTEVKPLWPKGWMQSRVLMRESRKLTGLFAAQQVNKTKSLQNEKCQSTVIEAPKSTDGCRSLQGTEELKVESGTSVSSPSKADKSPATSTSTPGRSLLDILADQALAREQPLTLSRDYLAAAVFKPWSFRIDDRSSPLPPPAPHSSPIDFPEGHMVLHQHLKVGDLKSLGVSQIRNGQ